MYKVSRRFIQTSKNSPVCEGHYEYQLTAREWQDNWMLPTTGWMSESKYRRWKQTIIEEDFPHCE